MKLFGVASLLLSCLLPHTLALSLRAEKRELLQDLVTWDEHSIFVRGERLMIYSGEFHPFRLPVPGLWLDVFQKIKALGFNGVSFYTNWGLVEAEPGQVRFEGIFALDEFFSAATEAGLYLIARPGPYINAEVAAGGFPGWVLNLNVTLRSDSQVYLDATQNYVNTIGKIIADAQITNGGPIILMQPENEYTTWPGVNLTDFPLQMNKDYMGQVEQMFRDTGVIVPFIDNDNQVRGDFAPGTGVGAVDIYGIDAYPVRYDCGHPSVWPNIRWPTNWQLTHEEESPTTPFSIPEYQGGSGEGWGGVDQELCADLVNEEALRVFYKHNYAFGVKLLNIYMTYGGTNWGNIAYMGGDTSYDYGAAINENRRLYREKYSEQKLQANFFKVSPAYLTAVAGNETNGTYASTTDINTTPVFGNLTNFYIVRHADFTSLNNTSYQFKVPTSQGAITIPQLGGSLSINGRDSKIHVTDYDVGGINLLYSSAEILSWAVSAFEPGHQVAHPGPPCVVHPKRDAPFWGGASFWRGPPSQGSVQWTHGCPPNWVSNGSTGVTLVLYGGAGETHEFAVSSSLPAPVISAGSSATTRQVNSTWVVQWQVTPTAQTITFGNFEVLLLWRNDAYNYWTAELEAPAPIGNYSSMTKSNVIVKAGYLIRGAIIVGQELSLTGDVNATTNVEVIAAPSSLTSITFNGQRLNCARSSQGRLTGTVDYQVPSIQLPQFSGEVWKSIDSLPEIKQSYDDSLWTIANHTTSNNDQLNLITPTSLFADEYGYHVGSLIYRGHFNALGSEIMLFLNTSGGSGYGHSVWLGQTFLGSWIGNGSVTHGQNFTISSGALQAGQSAIITVLIDHMGQDEEGPGTDAPKFPRGILDYSLTGHAQSDVSWKLTGNLGGEHYRDLVRGPRNEGAMYIERQGYHQPGAPVANWTVSSPVSDGLTSAGITFYATTFNLSMPQGFDLPMSFVFNDNARTNLTDGAYANYRCQLYVNGYQFGKYVNNLGPQTAFPVPEGILNYNGPNYIGLTLWSLDGQGAKLESFALEVDEAIMSSYGRVTSSPQPAWSPRLGAY